MSTFRDVIIIIWGIIGIIAFIAITIVSIMLYSRIKKVSAAAMVTLNKIEAIATRAQEISIFAGNEVVKPLIRVAAIIQGVRQGMSVMGRMFQKGEGNGK